MNFPQRVQAAILGSAIDKALHRGILDPHGANRVLVNPRKSARFTMDMGNGFPMRVWTGEWDHDEIRIAAALWPTLEVDDWLHAVRADKYAGEVFTSGYITRGSPPRLAHQQSPNVYIHPSRRVAMSTLVAPKVDVVGLPIFSPPSRPNR